MGTTPDLKSIQTGRRKKIFASGFVPDSGEKKSFAGRFVPDSGEKNFFGVGEFFFKFRFVPGFVILQDYALKSRFLEL